MSKTSSFIVEIVIGVIVAILVVFLIQQGRLISPEPYFVVDNQLLRPVNIYVDEAFRGEVDSQSLRTFLIDSYPVRVRFEVVRFQMSNGTLLGDSMTGHFTYGVNTGETITVDNTIGDNLYFYPMITNQNNLTCEFAVNAGGGSENRPGAYLPAYSSRVAFGYYRLYSNSNITLYCNNGRTYWWGTEPGKPSGTSLIPSVQAGTGVYDITLNP